MPSKRFLSPILRPSRNYSVDFVFQVQTRRTTACCCRYKNLMCVLFVAFRSIFFRCVLSTVKPASRSFATSVVKHTCRCHHGLNCRNLCQRLHFNCIICNGFYSRILPGCGRYFVHARAKRALKNFVISIKNQKKKLRRVKKKIHIQYVMPQQWTCKHCKTIDIPNEYDACPTCKQQSVATHHRNNRRQPTWSTSNPNLDVEIVRQLYCVGGRRCTFCGIRSKPKDKTSRCPYCACE